ncbi:hypothetical protein GTGU_03577 [Trabulsiella guamensis ATCC 49490]|uniref:Uncharacterized protein n=1 Tax=Trabulsiella guamensis ATCC 49490 TaxID=1005994 RepID=A0A084ZUB5_9ENTR|nr:hypothetical protein [Trabulsiella guamensis]KFC01060.1 hypothetical protein GTGU_03577 [Trabulsiella guamensis ATCC 49490]
MGANSKVVRVTVRDKEMHEAFISYAEKNDVVGDDLHLFLFLEGEAEMLHASLSEHGWSLLTDFMEEVNSYEERLIVA